MRYSVFPGDYTPTPPNSEQATIATISVWMLAVLPIDDPRRRIVAGIYAYWLDRGNVSDRQMNAMRKVFDRVKADHAEGLFSVLVAG